MAVQEVLTGIQIHRNGRYPYDYEQVHNSYSDVLEKLESDGNQGTKKGTFYAGMFTAVVDDENPSYNGPYYISYQKTGEPGNIKITYKATRIQLAGDTVEGGSGGGQQTYNNNNDNLYSYLAENYASHRQLNSIGECVDAAYVTNLGKEANLNIILSSLLTEAEYKKPSYNFKFLNGENGTEYGNVSNAGSGNVIEVGSTINLCLNLNLSYYNALHNTNGMSYGLSYCSFNHDGINYRYTSLGKHNLGVSYSFMKEGSHSMTDGQPISLCYLKSSYQGYAQLLSKGVYVPSVKNWFNDGRFNMSDYRIVAQYKYYYGWDANISDSSFTPKSGTAVWLPIISSRSTATTSNIAFNKSHTSFWFAIPEDIVDNALTSGFNVLYHTSIGDADLASTSATVTTETKTINVGTKTHSYKVTKVDFNKTISGASSNYVKFTMIKK